MNQLKAVRHLVLIELHFGADMQRMLEGKNHQTLYKVFMFVVVFIDSAIGMEESSLMKIVNLMYSELLLCAANDAKVAQLPELRVKCEVQKSLAQKTVGTVFAARGKTGLFALMSHLCDLLGHWSFGRTLELSASRCRSNDRTGLC